MSLRPPIWRLVLYSAISLALIACSDSPSGPEPVASVALTAQSKTVVVGGTLQVSASVKDAADSELLGRSVTWSSSDQSVATVNASGLVSGIAPGMARITATAEGTSGSVDITVALAPVESVAISPALDTLTVGETAQLQAAMKDSRGNSLAERAVTWTSSAEAVATVSSSGLVSAVGIGKATITGTSEGKPGTAEIVVIPVPVASVTVSASSQTLQLGTTLQVNVTAKDAGGHVLQGRTVKWTSSAASVATVSSDGVVTALAIGKSEISAEIEGKSASLEVTVIPVSVASVEVSPSTVTVQAGLTRLLSAVAKDGSSKILTGRPFSWSTSNVNVATVSSTGLVTGIAAGEARITATSEGKSGDALVTVTRAPTQVGGIISNNTTWTVSSSPYQIIQTVQIAHGATLSIEPGVVVSGDGKAIESWGTLRAVGTAANPVKFNNVEIVGRGSYQAPMLVQVEHAEITGGKIYPATGQGVYGRLILRDSEIRDLNQYSYIYLWYPVGDSYIERNLFINSGGISVGTDTRQQALKVYIRNNSFYDWVKQYEDFAITNWASYGSIATIIEHNSFWNTDRIAVRLPAGYDSAALNATNNFWGTTDEATIQRMIFDRTDDLGSASIVGFKPYLTTPHPETPVR